jgi:hypothetical protein
MAPMLLGMLGIACIIPQPFAVLSPDLPIRNTPPRLLQTRVPSETRETVRAGNCPNRTRFSAAVEEADVNDIINSVWVVDFDRTRPLVARPQVPNGSQVRTVEQPTGLGGVLLGLIDGREHVVQVFVTDGEFAVDESQPYNTKSRPLRFPDGGAVLQEDGGQAVDQSYTDSDFWLVRVTPCEP